MVIATPREICEKDAHGSAVSSAIRVRLRIERITCIYLPFGHRLLPAEERGQAMRSDRQTFYFLTGGPHRVRGAASVRQTFVVVW